jgi:MFS family permease
MFMEFLDGAILPTAAPTIARSFHILSAQVGICVTTYMVTILILIPISAWMTDKYGVRQILFGGIIVFVLASLGCALSTNLPELTAMRIVQGIGAATMVPVGRLILMRSVDKDQVIRAISYSVWPALAAPVVAPVLGGFIIQRASWHWIFLVNIPIGALALAAGWKIVPKIPGGRAEKLDWLGFYGSAGSLGLLVFGAANLGAPHINLLPTILLFALGIGIGIPTVLHLRRAKDPLVDLKVLAIQTFHLNTTSGLLFRVAQNTAPFLLPLLFQDKFGWNPQRAGAVLFFYMVGNLSFKVFTTPLMKRFSFKPLILICTLASTPLTLFLGLMPSSLPSFWMAVILIITGGVRSLGMTLYNTITFADTDQDVMSHANTIANMVQQLSSVIAVAVAVVALNLGRGAVGLSHQFTFAFSVAVGALLISLMNVLRLPSDAGQSLRK